MSESPIQRIEITKRIPFYGTEEDTLEKRLRRVTLRGFKEIRIYAQADFEIVQLTPEDILQKIHTPQLRVYRINLNRIKKLAELFAQQKIDICNLSEAYDYVAYHESGEETEWTMLPPIIEQFAIPRGKNNTLDYTSLIGEALATALRNQNFSLNPEAQALPHTSSSGIFDLINDGSHRIQFGYEQGGITVLRIKGVTHGYPYYAAPQPYTKVRVFATREEALSLPETKVHIITDPGHKSLYRLFPSGGIKSGDVRPVTPK